MCSVEKRGGRETVEGGRRWQLWVLELCVRCAGGLLRARQAGPLHLLAIHCLCEVVSLRQTNVGGKCTRTRLQSTHSVDLTFEAMPTLAYPALRCHPHAYRCCWQCRCRRHHWNLDGAQILQAAHHRLWHEIRAVSKHHVCGSRGLAQAIFRESKESRAVVQSRAGPEVWDDSYPLCNPPCSQYPRPAGTAR